MRDNSSKPTVTVVDNVYYLKNALDGAPLSSEGGSKLGATELASVADFADPALVTKLNDGRENGPWQTDFTGENGYAPVLKWEKCAGERPVTPQKLYPIVEKVTADDAARGVVLDVNPSVQAAAGKMVTVRAYVDGVNASVSGLNVVTGSGETVEVKAVESTNGMKEYQFEMPAHKVTVSATVADKDYPLEITSVEDWVKFAAAVNGGHDYTGETVRLSANLDFSSVDDLQPVGTAEHPFNGTVALGNSAVTFSNITINLPEQDNVGLFGVVGPQGNIANIKLQTFDITGKNNVGALIGQCQGSVKDIAVQSATTLKVTGEDNVGGILGSSQASGTPTITSCYVNGNISGYKNVGGIAGSTCSKNCGVNILYCYAIGSVYAADSHAGGLVGGRFDTYTPAVSLYDNYVLLSSVTAGNGLANDTVGLYCSFGDNITAQDNYCFDKMYINASDTARNTFLKGDGTVTAEQALQMATYANWEEPWILENGFLPYLVNKVATPAYFNTNAISAVADLSAEVANQKIPLGTTPYLPSTLKATVNATETEVPVTWVCTPNFSEEQPASYTYSPRFAENYTVDASVALPVIKVETLLVYDITLSVTPEDAQVVIKNDAGKVCTASYDGSYRLTAGNYTYTATAEGYFDKTGSFTVSQNETVAIKLTKQSDIPMGGGGSINDIYNVNIVKADNGSVTVSPKSAEQGQTVTVTVTPNTGYVLDTVTVTDANGKEITLSEKADNTYTFIMPNCGVNVKATFKAEETDKPTTNLPFADVKPEAWYAGAVGYVYENGLMNGIETTLFGPNDLTTRGMVVTILHRMENCPNAALSSFKDVAAEAYYAEAIAWAAANNIVKGNSTDQFSPNDDVTREQLAQILYGYAKYKGYNTTATGGNIKNFADYAKISDWAVEAMTWAVDSGMINGMGNNTLNPQGTATRAEIATMLQRFCENIAE